MTTCDEEIERLSKLLQIYRFNLHKYEEMEAKYGLDCPPYVLHAINDSKEKLKEIENELNKFDKGIPTLKKITPLISNNLPSRYKFVGRKKEINQAIKAIKSHIPGVIIVGIGGIGKSSLALEVAHIILSDNLFKGIVWIDGKENDISINTILNLIDKIICNGKNIKLSVEKKRDEIIAILRGKNYLIIIDNYENISDIQVYNFLKTIPEPSKFLLTSRQKFDFDDAFYIDLKGLDINESELLIRFEGERLGSEAFNNIDKNIILQFHEATGGAPLAIRWAVNHIINYNKSFELVVKELKRAQGNIFEVIFNQIWQSISIDSKYLLMSFPILSSSASYSSLQAVSNVYGGDFNNSIAQLSINCLLDSTLEIHEKHRRFSVHPLTRTFSEIKLIEYPDWEKQARTRWLEYFYHIIKLHGIPRNWKGFLILEQEFSDIWAIIKWCYNNSHVINKKELEPQELAFSQKLIEISNYLSSFLWEYGKWNERIQLSKWAIYASEQLNDITSIIIRSNDVGWTLFNQGDYKNAEIWLDKSIEMSKKVGIPDRSLFMKTNSYLGILAEEQGNLKKAEKIFKKILEYRLKESGDDLWGHKATSKLDLGRLKYKQGKLSAAKNYLQDALLEADKLENYNMKHKIITNLGHVAFAEKKINEAKKYYNLGLDELIKIKQPSGVAACKFGLAQIAEQEGELDYASELCNQALKIYFELGMMEEHKKVLSLLKRLSK